MARIWGGRLMTASQIVGADASPGFGTRAYRSYVLTALTFIYILNFVDRGLLAVVAPSLKPELGVSDTAFGLLTGFGFALLYTLVGVPLAHIAEKRSRVWIMTLSVLLWSVMTALCGLAQPVTIGGAVIGMFWILLVCRCGVAIGESGCTPPASSLIADYYPPHKRSTALGYYAMGVTLGGLLANLVGGPVTDAFGWRWAFVVLGVPGIAITLLLKATVVEPPRGYSDPPGAARIERGSFGEALRELARKPSFWTMAAAATLAAFAGYGISNFQSLFINRSFGLTTGQAALYINVPVSLACALGTLITGWLAEKIGRRHPLAIAWLPGVGLLISLPCHALAFTTDNPALCLIGLVMGGFIKYGYLAAQYTIGIGVVPARMRATSTAILLLVINLIGYGLGPLFTGAASDFFFNLKIAELGQSGTLSRAACDVAGAGLTLAQRDACAIANPLGLQQALLATSVVLGIAGFFFLWTCRWLRRDFMEK
jgi:MFS family permease